MAAKKKRHQRVDPNTLRALSFLAPNVPKRQLEKTVIKLARKAKVKPNRAGKALLGSLTRAGNKKQISKRRAIKPRAAATARMAGQFATLPPAENIGDIFYSPNSFLFVVYGHSGIYSSVDLGAYLRQFVFAFAESLSDRLTPASIQHAMRGSAGGDADFDL